MLATKKIGLFFIALTLSFSSPKPFNFSTSKLAPQTRQDEFIQKPLNITQERATQLLEDYRNEINPQKRQTLQNEILLLINQLNKIKALYFDITGALYQNDGPFAHEKAVQLFYKKYENFNLNNEEKIEFKKKLKKIFNSGPWAKQVRVGTLSFERYAEMVGYQVLKLIFLEGKELTPSTSRSLAESEYTDISQFIEAVYAGLKEQKLLHISNLPKPPILYDEEVFGIMYGDYPPAPGSVSVIQQLSQKGFKVYTVSNDADSERMTQKIKSDYGETTFADYFSSSALKVRKPGKEIFDLVDAQTGFKPEQVLFVDNKPEFIEAGLSYGYPSEEVDLNKDDDFRNYFLMNELLNGKWRQEASNLIRNTPRLSITDLTDEELKGKRVLVRVDFNVPIEDGVISDDKRIQAALPTIQYLIDKGAKVILISHLGRPKGKVIESLRLAPIAERLEQLLQSSHPGSFVTAIPDSVGKHVERALPYMKEKEIILLENLRFHSEETSKDQATVSKHGEQLARLADLYVNDAFGAAHRAHASIAGIETHFQKRASGFLLKQEIDQLTQVLNQPQEGFVAILGGAKVSDKISVIENLLPRIETLIIGGAMAYTFLKAQGVDVGKSLVEEKHIKTAKRILDQAEILGVNLLIPDDHVFADKKEDWSEMGTGIIVPEKMMGFDIGPRTIDKYSAVIQKAKTIIWNGPMGVFEQEEFKAGTEAVAQAVAQANAFSVIGGGDSAAAIKKFNLVDQVSHVSTGGGASLELLEGKILPGIAILSEVPINSKSQINPSEQKVAHSI